VYGARTVQMTQMPQMVALFNGVGGGAASLVALLELQQVVEAGGHDSWFNLAATASTIAVARSPSPAPWSPSPSSKDLMTSRRWSSPALPIVFAAALIGSLRCR